MVIGRKNDCCHGFTSSHPETISTHAIRGGSRYVQYRKLKVVACRWYRKLTFAVRQSRRPGFFFLQHVAFSTTIVLTRVRVIINYLSLSAQKGKNVPFVKTKNKDKILTCDDSVELPNLIQTRWAEDAINLNREWYQNKIGRYVVLYAFVKWPWCWAAYRSFTSEWPYIFHRIRHSTSECIQHQ